MQNTRQPKNKNLTIRLTENDKRSFEELARLNDISPSCWAHHILCKHKNSYGKTENVDQLLDGLETVIKSYDFILDELEKQIKNSYDSLSPEHANLVILRTSISLKQSEILKLKKTIMRSKMSQS